MFKPNSRTFIIILLLMISVIIPLNSPTQIASSQPSQPNPLEPTINITLLSYTQVAEPDYGGKEHPPGALYADFEGAIEADMNEATRVVVELSVSDTWSTSQISPNSILFSVSGDKPFRMTIKVPKNEKYNAEGSVTINAFWTVYPSGLSGSVDHVVCKIIVGQFCNFSLSTRNEEVDADIGSETKFEFEIRNEGNHQDSFKIIINNLDDLENKKIDIRLKTTTVKIPKGLSESITILVKPHKDFDLLKPEIEIEVSSINGTLKGMQPKTMVFKLSIEKKESSISKNVQYLGIFIFVISIVIIVLVIIRIKRKKS